MSVVLAIDIPPSLTTLFCHKNDRSSQTQIAFPEVNRYSPGSILIINKNNNNIVPP